MYSYKGKTALITGASSGIGEAFAKNLAAKGMNLILVARSEDKLKTLAAQLGSQHNIKAEVIAADLSQPNAAQAIYQTVQERGLSVDMLVNNAGFSTYGNFETISHVKEQDEIMVNVMSVVDLSHTFVPAMLARGEGAIINVASVGGFVPIARQAVYAATKAFVLSFSEALYVEYRKRGLSVFALCPGGVETGFAEVINMDVKLQLAQPEWVVAKGLKAFERGKHFTVPGPLNYFYAVILPRLLPRSVFARMFAFFAAQMMVQRPTKPQTLTAK